MELAGLGKDIHPQHGVVLGDAAAHGNAGQFVDKLGHGANNGAGRVAFLVRFAQWICCREGFVTLASVVFKALSDSRIELFVPVFIHQLAWISLVIFFSQIAQAEICEYDFLRDAAVFLQSFRLTVDSVLVCGTTVTALRCAGNEQRFQRSEFFRRVTAQTRHFLT